MEGEEAQSNDSKCGSDDEDVGKEPNEESFSVEGFRAETKEGTSKVSFFWNSNSKIKETNETFEEDKDKRSEKATKSPTIQEKCIEEKDKAEYNKKDSEGDIATKEQMAEEREQKTEKCELNIIEKEGGRLKLTTEDREADDYVNKEKDGYKGLGHKVDEAQIYGSHDVDHGKQPWDPRYNCRAIRKNTFTIVGQNMGDERKFLGAPSNTLKGLKGPLLFYGSTIRMSFFF